MIFLGDFSSDRSRIFYAGRDAGGGESSGLWCVGEYREEARREGRALFCDMCGAGRGPGIVGPAQGLKGGSFNHFFMFPATYLLVSIGNEDPVIGTSIQFLLLYSILAAIYLKISFIVNSFIYSHDVLMI